jgi:adenylate cyclase
MISSVVLIVLMAAIAYALASYRAGQITRPISALSHATVELANGRLKRDLPITTDDELGTLTDAFNRMRVRLQESEAALVKSNEQLHDANQDLERHNRFVRDTFGRYLSDDIVANLLDTPEGLALGGENREVTILMSDLRGFTSLAARLEPEQVVTLLNRYFGVMVDVITRHDGTIDEFIGDAILVIFGAPIAREDHARAAVACAVEMQLAMGLVNEQNRGVGLPEVEMGIGINTGQVVVGNIGSDTRAKYGVVGSPVNLTSRIESYTVGGQILISEATQRAAGPILTLGDTLEIEAKGVDAPMTICEVLGIGGAYDLQLIEDAENLVTLAAPIPLEYVIVEGKHLDATLHHGTLVKLSTAGGEVLAEHAVAARSNIRVQLRPVGGPPVAGELYAKVMAPLPDGPAGFSIRFTSIPPEVTAMFARWIA